MSLFLTQPDFENSTEEFYSNETLSTLVKLLSSLSSLIWCHISIINAHKILIKPHRDWPNRWCLMTLATNLDRQLEFVRRFTFHPSSNLSSIYGNCDLVLNVLNLISKWNLILTMRFVGFTWARMLKNYMKKDCFFSNHEFRYFSCIFEKKTRTS
jgi:hypothetical protein